MRSLEGWDGPSGSRYVKIFSSQSLFPRNRHYPPLRSCWRFLAKVVLTRQICHFYKSPISLIPLDFDSYTLKLYFILAQNIANTFTYAFYYIQTLHKICKYVKIFRNRLYPLIYDLNLVAPFWAYTIQTKFT